MKRINTFVLKSFVVVSNFVVTDLRGEAGAGCLLIVAIVVLFLGMVIGTGNLDKLDAITK